MKLMGNRLIVQQDESLTKSNGGIFLPPTSQEQRNVGKVIVVGDDADQDLLNKEVMFNLQSAQNFEFGETKGKLIFVVDLVAILN